MKYGFSTRNNMRTYSLDFREQNYPKFEGLYNVYIAVYGQLSGEYLGSIERPLAMSQTEENASELLLNAEQFINDNRYTPVSIW